MKSSSDPIFSISFDQPIWRLIPDSVGDSLVLELRSDKKLEKEVWHIDLNGLKSSRIDSEELSNWWISVWGLEGVNLILNQHTDKQNPGPGTLLIYDLQREQILRKEEQFIVDRIENGTLRGRAYSGSESNEVTIKLDQPGKIATIAYPRVYLKETETFDLVTELLEEFEIQPVREVAYHEMDDNIIVGYYVELNGSLTRKLVCYQSGELRFNLTLDEKIAGLASDSFITIGKNLIFVVERKQLVIHEL